ncbi:MULTISPECIES: DEAD/DEAH box helicase [unclassified Cyanobium]|uniref:DEAD/DEAH box helicase n=1 Tax=unclassified Cyanobium TaxID=2627006 RepID=UPI0020CD07DA|nr:MULTISPECIES: DEAD/DEAH box helicase [unclassified Cyanobium]
MALSLRPYQQNAVDQLRLAFMAGHRSVLFVLPTGGGKTVVFSHIAQQAAARGNRIAVLVHRVELLEQASRSLAALSVEHGLIASGRSMNLRAPVQVASVATLARRLDMLKPEHFQLLVVDECHHASAGTWAKALEHFSGAKVLGVTATPCRSDGRSLGAWFSTMVHGPSPAWLTDNGYLAPARVYAPPIGFSAQGLRRRMGDFDLRQAAGALGGSRILGDAVSHYERHLSGRTAIAFCCSIAHAQAVAEAFSDRGIRAASIDGSQDSSTRRQLLEELGSGALRVLTSCSLIGEGVDVPSVGGCILLRPTQSEALHLQMIGRCLRPQAGKEAVILDHVGNLERLGHHLEERHWTLQGSQRRERQAAAAIKVCPQCFCTTTRRVSACPECGHLFRPQRKKPAVVAGSLQEVSQEQLKVRRKQEQGEAHSMEELIALGQRRGMKNPRGWARHVLAARQTKGHWSRVA